MPILEVSMLKGRTLEQKREMVQRVTQDIVETLNCPKEAVKIMIREMEFEDYGEAGVLRCDKK